LVVLEAGLRVRQRFNGIPLLQSAGEYSDSEFGWKGTFVSGDISTQKPKILFVGDSFTDGLGVPPDAMYFRVAAKLLGIEAFAYGGKGYGTLQELLVLE